ncbi:hypothetical protein, partial [Wolbachia endosymbiont of Drosophila sechellia]|uniref:hypothetical protein n=1 Tax=Wolbachia endosymbiont of Drosophila sechellia TaxID=375925 RepID=UPI001CA3ACAC
LFFRLVNFLMFMAKRQSSSRCLLAGSRDTANESRYDGSRRYDVGLLSSQCPNTGIQFSLQIHQKCFIL